jgi:hypothetical protein
MTELPGEKETRSSYQELKSPQRPAEEHPEPSCESGKRVLKGVRPFVLMPAHKVWLMTMAERFFAARTISMRRGMRELT